MKKVLVALLMLFCVGVFAKPVIVMETTEGTIEITLNPEVAPKACENMIELAKKQYYDGTKFHRVIPNFMIQGGDPQGTGRGGASIWGDNFKDEFKSDVKFNRPGLLAMANRGPNTNGSQFFITTTSTPWLDYKHTIFGEVTKGYDVVKKLESFGTPSGSTKKELKLIRVTVREDAE
ncbi:peptidylprolyl isomerase [Simkania negevensis]|uniref:Peptidyl-prolyl cis-trans isomerase n=1 Tax=Simkania negevensis (strain ATCC VR-1471 / DSM 27360 / Z) TaxID=331113 RepID=F8L4J2_SIMNZ|nr:peptidylprolyl isomerase [Simkania negevensis]MCB1067833.1 peptidylprolyl isomerase [Simkania sp.]MCB1075661.1 peptidylprolyl isomerase [Simkania sp.]MCP5491009.1 peptidylprolyl isomerase [Chlamydiales bacterium]CCB90245.1 putative peptidylprolyl isomerase II (Cyclophilin A) [Simkania negevensis Z]